MRWTELGITTQREPAHSLLTRAGYVGLDGRTFTPLGERLLARLFPGGVEPRTAPPGTRARQKLLVALEYLVAAERDIEPPDALPVVRYGWGRLSPTPQGEVDFARCTACDYEGMATGYPAFEPAPPGEPEPLVEHFTPDCPGIDAVVAHFRRQGMTAARMLKSMAMEDAEGRPTVVLLPGDRAVRPDAGFTPMTADDLAAHPQLVPGYIGPVGLQDHGIRVVAEYVVQYRPGPWCTGANKPDHHVTGARLGRDFAVDEFKHVSSFIAGDPCPFCHEPVELARAIEVRSAGGVVGASRVVGLLAEGCHDDAGLAWPPSVAPFETHLISLRGADAEAAAAALDGPAVLWDDRDASPGVKFADADLIGLPTQLIVGPKSLARGVIERKDRRTGTRTEVPLANFER